MSNRTGVGLIADERQRQITEEYRSAKHDDSHRKGELGLAAASYLLAVVSPDESGDAKGKPRPCHDWPWLKRDWKPSEDPVRNLVKAGALIAAEIDRLLRKAERHEEMMKLVKKK